MPFQTHAEPKFTEIVIIESLKSEDSKTGQRLAGQIGYTGKKLGIPVRLELVETLVELRQVYEKIQQRSINGSTPLIHYECHGDPCFLVLHPSLDRVDWPEFARLHRPINDITDNRLTIFLGACHGLYSLLSISISEVAPFLSLAGCQKRTFFHQSKDDYTDFYLAILKNQPFRDAVASLPGKYEFFHSEELFFNSFLGYVRDHCIGDGRRDRIDRLVSNYLAYRGNYLPFEKRRGKGFFKRFVRPSLEAFRRFKRRFLLSDRPSNRGRFRSTFKGVFDEIRNSRLGGLSQDANEAIEATDSEVLQLGIPIHRWRDLLRIDPVRQVWSPNKKLLPVGRRLFLPPFGP
jgi:hypothetical protein